ncbi:MAG: HAD-IIIA family hydrolase [Bacteroides sp.]|nr:HAD-IIIA family hydrolase [Bacteroides sp.]
MSGINYDLRKIKGFVFDVDGVLSPSTVPLGEDGYPKRMVSVKDGYALQLAMKLGFKIAVITGGSGTSIIARFKSLRIEDVYTNAHKKLPMLQEWLKKNKLSAEEVAYMGDDIPDLPCMRNVGLPAAPFDACWEAKETAAYISKFSGGYGCVRDLIEQTLKAQDLWLTNENAFNW